MPPSYLITPETVFKYIDEKITVATFVSNNPGKVFKYIDEKITIATFISNNP